jgi:hypothetical protein
MPKKAASSGKSKKSIVTVDIDMTLANHHKRLMRACRGGLLDKKVLFSEKLILSDKVIRYAPAALRAIRKKHSIVFLSSRTKSVTGVTEKWLKMHKLMAPGDKLIVVGSEVEKLRHFRRLLPRLYAVIDDFKFDFQSGKPRVSDRVLPHLLKLDVYVIIFEDNWRRIVKTYFS